MKMKGWCKESRQPLASVRQQPGTKGARHVYVWCPALSFQKIYVYYGAAAATASTLPLSFLVIVLLLQKAVGWGRT